MPRETVVTDVRPYGDDVPAVSAVELTWSREGQHVQMGTVCVNAEDGAPFTGAVRAGNGPWVHMSGGHYVGSTYWGPPTYVGGEPFWPQYPTFDPGTVETIPMIPMPGAAVDKTGWCDDCKEGRHVQCVDDTEEHSATDPDWCRCPCGEIKRSLIQEEQGFEVPLSEDGETVSVDLVGTGQTGGAAGHFVQLNRKELNELIRKLKRAGRMTFGEDEW